MRQTSNEIRVPIPSGREAGTDCVTYRTAVANDSRFIAAMVELSSDGIASIEWHQKSESSPGLDALDFGSRQYQDDEGDYSYRNCVIAETDEPVGMILSFPITQANLSRDAKPPPYEPDDIYAPYKYLEAVDSWYICGVAVTPEFRKRGIGEHLIRHSMEQGRSRGYDNTSLIAMAEKKGLIAFYESLGFTITRRAPIVEYPGIRAKEDAVLMETRPS